jgi:hypothetical protein
MALPRGASGFGIGPLVGALAVLTLTAAAREGTPGWRDG